MRNQAKKIIYVLLVLCLMASSMGAMSWGSETPTVAQVEQTYSNGSQYMPNTSTTLTAYDEDGKELWSWTSPVAGNEFQVSEITEFAENERIVAVVVLNTLYVFDRNTGVTVAVAEDVMWPVQVVVDEQDRIYLAGYLSYALRVYDTDGNLVLDLQEAMPEVDEALYGCFRVEFLEDEVVRINFEGAEFVDKAAAIAVEVPGEWEGESRWYLDIDMKTVLPEDGPSDEDLDSASGS